MRLNFWEKKVKDGNLSMFKNLDEALNKTTVKLKSLEI